jgi:hypothetical protein
MGIFQLESSVSVLVLSPFDRAEDKFESDELTSALFGYRNLHYQLWTPIHRKNYQSLEGRKISPLRKTPQKKKKKKETFCKFNETSVSAGIVTFQQSRG